VGPRQHDRNIARREVTYEESDPWLPESDGCVIDLDETTLWPGAVRLQGRPDRRERKAGDHDGDQDAQNRLTGKGRPLDQEERPAAGNCEGEDAPKRHGEPYPVEAVPALRLPHPVPRLDVDPPRCEPSKTELEGEPECHDKAEGQEPPSAGPVQLVGGAVAGPSQLVRDSGDSVCRAGEMRVDAQDDVRGQGPQRGFE
jgi:hypothetical protein